VSSTGPDVEADRHRSLIFGWRAESRESSETTPAALRLTGILPRDVAADEILLRRDDLALLVERALLTEAMLGALAHEIRVAAIVGLSGAALEVQHVVGGRVQEGTVVAHDQDTAGEVAQVPLEPLRRLEVEVVGGLVEQEEIRGSDELAGQTKPAALAAAQGADQLSSCPIGIESKSLENGRDAGVDRVAIGALELLEIAAVTVQQLLGCMLSQLSDLGGMSQHLVLQLHQIGIGREGGVPHGFDSGELPVLVEHRHPEAARPAHDAAVWILFPGDESKQRGLAAPIAPHDSPALPLVHHQVQVPEEDVAAIDDGGRRDV